MRIMLVVKIHAVADQAVYNFDEDDTFDPIVHTPSRISSSDDEDSDNEVEGMDVEGAKSDEDATYVQAAQEIKDTHMTLTPVNLDGRQQSSSVSSGFVSNMLNPNQDTSVDAIFRHNVEATSLIDIPVTAIVKPSFFTPTNRPPTPTPLFIQIQQPPILTPATTPSSSLQNCNTPKNMTTQRNTTWGATS
ncbi:hypothetical protein Tco_0165185 [Tanacetum coccineum]